MSTDSKEQDLESQDAPVDSGTTSPAKTPPRQPKERRGFWLWLAKYYLFGLIVALAHLIALLAALYVHRSRHVPATPTRHQARSSAQALTRIYAGNGRLVGELAVEWRQWTPYDKIPPQLVQAFIAVEDRRFLQHRGIDWMGLARAAWINMRTGRVVQGGSTITQQLAKTYIGTQRTVDRKIREAILATRIEASLRKSEILELYLNRIFLGNGAYGISAAARRYFDKRLDQLTLSESALIAGLARAPSRYNPFLHAATALARRNVVLRKMRQAGFISVATLKKALVSDTEKGAPALKLRRRYDYFHNEVPYFTEHVRQQVLRLFGKDRINQGGLRVETTVDTEVQAAARRNVDELARWVDKRQGWRGPVAHLTAAPERKDFRATSKSQYGSAPLVPGRRYLALVERSGRRAARVTVGGHPFTIPRRYLRWGARFYTRSQVNDRFINNAWQVLIPGDVIWVRLAPKKIYDPLLPGSDGCPSVHSGSYRKPPVPLRDGRPACRIKPLDVPRGPDWPGPPYLALEQTPRLQGALFTYDLKTGYVISMVGGTDYDRSSFNRVTQACRQPGSTYKPIYYSLAMDRGMSFHKLLKDKPYSIVDPLTGRVWYAHDFAHNPEVKRRFADRINNYKKTLEQALVWSKNKASVNLFMMLGAKAVKSWARKLGFTTEIIADEALALGASCTRADELARSFAVFGTGGHMVDPVYIRRIVDRHGQVLVDNTVPYDPMLDPGDRFDRLFAWAGRHRAQAIAPKTAYRTSQLLRKVVTQGHAAVVRMTRIPAAGKTGTASRTADTWFVGYTSRWLTSAWLGDDHYVRSIGRHDASFSTALPMWARYMYDTARHQPLREVPWLDNKGNPRKDLAPVIPATLRNTHKPDFQPPYKPRKRRKKPQ
jgi:penicillin-binding protein 1A